MRRWSGNNFIGPSGMMLICRKTTPDVTVTWFVFCSQYSFLLFHISCGPPSIWPHLISRKNDQLTHFSLRLIDREELKWSCWSCLCRCKNQVGSLFTMTVTSEVVCPHIVILMSEVLAQSKTWFWTHVIVF